MNEIQIPDSQIVVSLTAGQLRSLLRECLAENSQNNVVEEKHYVYGLRGIQTLLNCSHTQAQRYKDTVLKDAVMQNGRKIVVDADKALELFNNRKNSCFFLYTAQITKSFCFFASSEPESYEEDPQKEKLPEEEVSSELTQEEEEKCFFKIETLNEVLERLKDLPVAKDLFLGVWHEGEIAFLFSDAGVGKTMLAFQIAEEIANKALTPDQGVLYIDLELHETQLRDRYYNKTLTQKHLFPRNFYFTKMPYNYYGSNIERILIKEIDQNARKGKIKVVIIDNITCIIENPEKGENARQLMMQLMNLKHKYGLSILVIGHTPKRNEYLPIEISNLAGSKILSNLCDSVFAIGKSRKGSSLRYLKQLKSRNYEILYDRHSVLTLERVKEEDGNIHFLFKDTELEPEEEHLPQQYVPHQSSRDNLSLDSIKYIQQLKIDGKSVRDIENITGVSKSTVQRVLTKYPPQENKPKDEHMLDPEQEHGPNMNDSSLDILSQLYD